MTRSAAVTPRRRAGGASAARRCALRVVRRVFADGAFADRALRAESERDRLQGRDRALAERLAFGTIQRRALLDHVLGSCSDRPLEAVDDPLREALRLGVLQLLFFDAIPDRAAVEQTVELAREAVGARATGFANAVMRRAARDGPALLAALDDSTPEGAAVRHSHPEWLARLWWDALGPDDARALLAHDNEPPELALRANGLVATRREVVAALRRAGADASVPRDPPEAVVVRGRLELTGTSLFRSGAITPQSRASMLVARALEPAPGERVLDLCAAPGAKTTHLAALMRGRGELVAVERHPRRAAALSETCRRMQASFVEIVTADARDAEVGEDFDGVLLDPPCSDLGTLAARPDARWRKSPEQIAELARLQAELLDAAARRVRPGGILVYSTCTISPLENGARIEAFLAAHPDFSLEDLGERWPSLRATAQPLALQTLPHREGTSGFFVSRLRRAT